MRTIISITTIILATAVFSKKMDSINWKKGSIIIHSSASFEIIDYKPVNADSHEIISFNRARKNAYKRARHLAYEKIVSKLKKVRVDSNNTIYDLLQRKDIVQSKLSIFLHEKINFDEYPVDFFTSGCRASIKIRDMIPMLAYDFPSNNFPYILDNPISTRYTGVIIDTRGLKVEPMIFPAIINEDGLEFYARHFIDPTYASKYGLVAYVYNEDQAMANKRAGNRPFYTAAIKSLNGCPVVSNKDMRKILSSPETQEYLKKCRVIFIIAKDKGK